MAHFQHRSWTFTWCVICAIYCSVSNKYRSFPLGKQLAKACYRHSNTCAQYFTKCEEHKTMSIFHSPFFMWLWTHFVFIALFCDVQCRLSIIWWNCWTKSFYEYVVLCIEVNVGNAIFRYSPLWFENYSTTMIHSKSNWTLAYSRMLALIANEKTRI